MKDNRPECIVCDVRFEANRFAKYCPDCKPKPKVYKPKKNPNLTFRKKKTTCSECGKPVRSRFKEAKCKSCYMKTSKFTG